MSLRAVQSSRTKRESSGLGDHPLQQTPSVPLNCVGGCGGGTMLTAEDLLFIELS
jgi:hypothetical protein